MTLTHSQFARAAKMLVAVDPTLIGAGWLYEEAQIYRNDLDGNGEWRKLPLLHWAYEADRNDFGWVWEKALSKAGWWRTYKNNWWVWHHKKQFAIMDLVCLTATAKTLFTLHGLDWSEVENNPHA